MSTLFIRAASLVLQGPSKETFSSFTTTSNPGSVAQGEETVTPGPAVDLSALQFRFEIEQQITSTPNVLRARVYNVSSKTLQVVKEFTRVSLKAGYKDNVQYGTIFSGNIIQTRSGRENATDTYFDILAGDTDQGLNWATINDSRSSDELTPQAQIDLMLQALGPFGVLAGYTPVSGLTTPSKDTKTPSLPRGKAFFGMVRDYYSDLEKTLNCTFSLLNGQVYIVPNNGIQNQSAIVVNSHTGMIGLPTQDFNGINVRTLLNANIVPGSIVQIDQASIQTAVISPDYQNTNITPTVSLAADGFYKVFAVSHRGDTRGNDWYSDMICVNLNGAPSQGLVIKGYLG